MKCFYALRGVKFEHKKEGFAHLILLEEKTAITVVSTPKPIGFPLKIFPKFAEERKILLEEALMARKISLNLFTPL